MKKWIIIGAAVVAAGAGAFFYVRQSQAAKSASPQTTAKAERGQVRSVVASTGRVVANQDVDIKCKASGEIIELPFDISDEVKEGELLLKLDPNDQERILRQTEVALQASQAKLATAQENLQIAQRTLITDEAKAKSDLQTAQAKAKDARAKADRTKQLFDKKLSSQEELDTAETAAIQAAGDLRNVQVRLEELKTQEAALELERQDVKLAEAQEESNNISVTVAQDRVRDTRVAAPIDGVVSARNVQIGQIISSGISNVGGGTTTMILSDLSRIFVLASVDESDIGQVKAGQPATITADACPSLTMSRHRACPQDPQRSITDKVVNNTFSRLFSIRNSLLQMALKLPPDRSFGMEPLRRLRFRDRRLQSLLLSRVLLQDSATGNGFAGRTGINSFYDSMKNANSISKHVEQ